jgi:nucleotide-binding universal stress UspA family protein
MKRTDFARTATQGNAMKRIMVADDGSAPALHAVELAAELAAQAGAELIALAVIDPAKFRPRDVEAFARSEELDDGGALGYLIDVSADHLDRCRRIAAGRGVARFRAATRVGGHPAAEILEAAADEEIDLIVIGSRGRGRLPGLLLGSVSQELATHAHCAVLIAR